MEHNDVGGEVNLQHSCVACSEQMTTQNSLVTLLCSHSFCSDCSRKSSRCYLCSAGNPFYRKTAEYEIATYFATSQCFELTKLRQMKMMCRGTEDARSDDDFDFLDEIFGHPSVNNQVAGCTLCSDLYASDGDKTPLVVPCGHTLCSTCITEHVAANGKTCPICRAAFRKEVTALPPNRALVRQILSGSGGSGGSGGISSSSRSSGSGSSSNSSSNSSSSRSSGSSGSSSSGSSGGGLSAPASAMPASEPVRSTSLALPMGRAATLPAWMTGMTPSSSSGGGGCGGGSGSGSSAPVALAKAREERKHRKILEREDRDRDRVGLFLTSSRINKVAVISNPVHVPVTLSHGPLPNPPCSPV